MPLNALSCRFASLACLSLSCLPSWLHHSITRIVRIRFAFVVSIAASLGFTTPCVHATTSMLAPLREAAFDEPLSITLLYSADDNAQLDVTLPATIRVTLTNGDIAPQPLELMREPGVSNALHLSPGQFRKVRYSAPWPAWARGEVRIDPVGFDASPTLVAINRGPREGKIVQAERAEMQAATPAQTASAAAAVTPASSTEVASPAADALMSAGRAALSRISYYEPMYFAAGHNGDTNARLQLSFKYRLLLPDDLRSKRFLDNLYFAYTQMSIWDLSAESRPFHDTSYMPQLFYYIPDTGVRSEWFTRMGIAAGIGHESNGLAGDNSRSLNIVFVRPTWEFGDLNSTHLEVSPKVYFYFGTSSNPDIADYRGYVDLLIKYGSPDGWQLATTLRKGTKHWYGSVDTQLTYPLAKLLGSSAWGGYLWVGYFNGYGEDLLDYNKRQHWMARIGYSIAR
ncbi:phospholipase A [Paraburkholderia hospita]|uniref:phospholipase A n=1 Tax=Paraburkholderia hospita TaxID=169430 RepID=UPI001F6013C4|nr:phospholipase A [Paraburkholderia hospita]